MTEFRFAKYYGFIKMHIKLINKSPLLIKSGDSPFAATSRDMVFVRNANYEIYIPGSTLKGFCRGNLERLEILQNNNIIPDNFGSMEYASRIFFGEFKPVDPSSLRFEVRTQIAINPKTMGTKKGALFNLECLAAGTEFEGTVTIRNPRSHSPGLIYLLENMANDELIRLGFNKTRGFGKIELRTFKLEFILADPEKCFFKFDTNKKALIFRDGKKEFFLIESEYIKVENIAGIFRKYTVEDAGKVREFLKASAELLK